MSDDTYPNAGRESGYTDEAGRPVGEDLVNKLTIMLAAPQTKLVQLAAKLDATIQTQDQRFHYILTQMAAFLEKEDQRHGVYDAAEQSTLQALTSIAHRLDEITSYVQQGVTISREAKTIAQRSLAVSEEAARGQKKLDKDVRQLKQAMAESKKDRAQIHVEVAGVKSDVAALQERMDKQTEIERRLAALEDARG